MEHFSSWVHIGMGRGVLGAARGVLQSRLLQERLPRGRGLASGEAGRRRRPCPQAGRRARTSAAAAPAQLRCRRASCSPHRTPAPAGARGGTISQRHSGCIVAAVARCRTTVESNGPQLDDGCCGLLQDHNRVSWLTVEPREDQMKLYRNITSCVELLQMCLLQMRPGDVKHADNDHESDMHASRSD